MNVSVIIRNRNEEQYIGFAIQSCLDYLDNPEIIIIDNNSTDESLHVVNLFKDRTTIKIVTIDDYTPGRSINLGAQYATNDTILVLSAHSQITNLDISSITNVLGSSIDNKYCAIFGQQNPIYMGKKISKRYIWSHFGDNIIENMYSNIENRQFLHNAFCFYSRNFLIDNPMPEEYPGKEDRFWALDMVNKGETYLYDPNIKCNHYYTGNGATWKGLG